MSAYSRCYEGREVVKRALSMIGPVDYNILRRNCEHFASWCRYDKSISQQVLLKSDIRLKIRENSNLKVNNTKTCVRLHEILN